MNAPLILCLGYSAVFVSAALWIVHYFWLRDRGKLPLAARGSSALAIFLLLGGLAAYGFRVGYWPFHTNYELLNVGLAALLLAMLTLLSPRRDGFLLMLLSAGASLIAVYGAMIGIKTGAAVLGHDSWWRAAYVLLSAFGGGALLVTGAAALAAWGRKPGSGEKIAAQRALPWALLALSVGMACGAWYFQRLLGRYWGDARWMGVLVVGLLTAAMWHLRGKWLERGWRLALVGLILCAAGGYVVLGMSGGLS